MDVVEFSFTESDYPDERTMARMIYLQLKYFHDNNPEIVNPYLILNFKDEDGNIKKQIKGEKLEEIWNLVK